MRFLCLLVLSGAFSCLVSQTVPSSPEDPEVLRARIEADRIRVMVDTGAVPRAQLAKAEAALADAQDAATIKHTIYSQDLSEDQANDLVAAASRRFDRRKEAFDEAKKLVDLGIAAQNSLQAKLEDMDFARTECELATSRAQLSRELAAMAEAEAAMPHPSLEPPIPDAPPESRYDGNGVFTPVMLSH